MSLGTPSIKDRHERNDLKLVKMTFLGDDAYAAGGTADFNQFVRDAITAAAAAASDANVRGAEAVSVIEVIAGDCGTLVPSYDSDNDKLKCRNISDGSEASGDLSSVSLTVTAVCK